MKILFLGDPDSANTSSWIDGLRQGGCDVVVGSARSDGSAGVFPLGPSWLPARLRILFGRKDALALVERFRPDLVIAYRVTSYGYLGARLGFHPLAIAAQNEQITYMRHPFLPLKLLLERFARRAVAAADLFHAWGGNLRDGLLRFGADPDKILVLHRGVDLSVFSADLAARSYSAASPVFVSTRALAPEYRLDQLIRAFKLLVGELPGARLEIIGDGSERGRLEDFAKDLGLADKVSFLGRLPRREVAARLAAAEIYISLIETEGVSSSLIEACAAGLTPILFDMPASRDLVQDGVNGFLLDDISSPARVAAAMRRCAEAVELRRSAAVLNAKLAQERFDNRRNLAAFVERYRQLAGGRHGR